jgi:uncharacterized protein YyaL (SSP411 family)
MNDQRKPNPLIDENSPYLLQHAYNPVNWRPWSQETLKLAQEEDKPLLISTDTQPAIGAMLWRMRPLRMMPLRL